VDSSIFVWLVGGTLLNLKIGIDHFLLSKLVSLNSQFIYPVWLLLLQNMFVILSIVILTIKLLATSLHFIYRKY
jgi:hypothetical protein